MYTGTDDHSCYLLTHLNNSVFAAAADSQCNILVLCPPKKKIKIKNEKKYYPEFKRTK